MGRVGRTIETNLGKVVAVTFFKRERGSMLYIAIPLSFTIWGTCISEQSVSIASEEREKRENDLWKVRRREKEIQRIGKNGGTRIALG